METTYLTEDEIEIDLGDIFAFLISKIGYVILCGAALAVAVFAILTFLVTPKYTSTTKMYVLNRQTADSVTNSDLQSSTYLTKDYVELVKSRTVIETVIAELGLGRTYEDLLDSLSVSSTTDTRVVAISVTDEDPYMARDIANEIRSIAAAHIQSVMNTEAVNVVDEANIPTKKSSPSVTRDTLLAGIIGAALAVAVLIILYLSNDKVTTAEDVERYLGLSVLAAMPLEEEEVQKKKARKRLARKQQRVLNGKKR